MTVPSMARTFLAALEGGSANHPALVVPDGPRLTYGALRDEAERMARTLAALGVRRGDRVATVLTRPADSVIAFFGAGLAATAAPLNPGLTETEYRALLSGVRARVVVVPPGQASAVRRARTEGMLVVDAALGADGKFRVDANASGRQEPEHPSEEDVALVLHSSGTTGRPKRVALRHRHLMESAERIRDTYGLSPEDVSLAVMPLFHVHGLVASVLAVLRSGGTVLLPPRFDHAAFSSLAADHSVTWCTAVPTFHQLVLARCRADAPRPSRLRFLRSASAKLSLRTLTDLEARFAVPVIEAYGMTEAAHQIASNPLPPGRRVPGSVGPGTGVRVAVVDEQSRFVTEAMPGEVVIRGPNVIERYDDDPEADAGSFVDGWFRTGDAGSLDTDGYVRLAGRIREVINRGGEKIMPLEIDEVLGSHPAVAAAACFGTPHPLLGEEVAAAVVLRQPVSKGVLLRHCRERLAAFKIPKRLFIVAELPRTPLGKVSRLRLASLLGVAA